MSVPFGKFVCCVNRHAADLKLNSDLKLWMSPAIAIHGDPCHFILELAAREHVDSARWNDWKTTLRQADDKKSDANTVFIFSTDQRNETKPFSSTFLF